MDRGVVSEGLPPEAGEACRNQRSSGKQALSVLCLGFLVYVAQHRAGCRSKYKPATSKTLTMGFQSLLPSGFIISCFLFPTTASHCIPWNRHSFMI